MKNVLRIALVCCVLAAGTTGIATVQNVNAAQPAANGRTYNVVLPGTTLGWLNTGIWLQHGQMITVVASGTINLWPDCETAVKAVRELPCDAYILSPAGGQQGVLRSAPDDYWFPRAPIGALIGRIGYWARPFFIGNGTYFRMRGNGFLMLAINDIFAMEDNSGAFYIEVTVQNP